VDLTFDGNPVDLERILGMVALQFALHAGAFTQETTKTAYLVSHFRGAALDWGTRLVIKNDNRLQSYDKFTTSLKDHFGYDYAQLTSLHRTQLTKLTQTGDLMEFLTEFDNLSERVGLRADPTKITLVLPKLKKEYYDAIADGGDTIENYSTLRLRLLNIYAMKTGQPPSDEAKRKKSRCGKCGKRGHSATQCKSTN
jgi:hypothetical protein